jgi:hypothetical protein
MHHLRVQAPEQASVYLVIRYAFLAERPAEAAGMQHQQGMLDIEIKCPNRSGIELLL